ncbi:MAG: capsular polysaccharide biosynthesis protein [Verrucomicrobiota bacterium]
MNQRTQGEAAWIYRKVLAHPLLAAFLQQQGAVDGSLQVGWGFKASGLAAMKAAKSGDARLLLLEDAFVRSLRPGKDATVYGLIADSRGIHYDATGESDLLTALDTGKSVGWMRPDLGDEDVPALMERFRQTGASKYNWFPGEVRDDDLPEREGILVVDQTRGDAAITRGGLALADFDRMLRDALDTSDGAPVYVRAHPDHLYRKKHSCFSPELLADKRIHLLSPDLSPAQCFRFCPTVMVGTSLMGMEALIHGRKVVTYGRPFFAGRGLTEDRGGFESRRPVDLADLFAAAYLRYSHYFDPDSREPCGLGEILDHLALQKEMFRRNRGRSVTVGFSPWNRKIAASYLRSPAGEIIHNCDGMAEATRILVWGRKAGRDLPEATHVEDGFIRSKGLGAAFNFPYSWVLDSRGIYFDSSGPSDLEEIYNQGFATTDLAQARELIAVLREKRLTKYNLAGDRITLDESLVKGRKVILVPGQVEADASIAFGSPEVRSNIELLRRVRAAEPDAYLVFKAHPDLVAGARHGNVLPEGFAEACDLAVTEGNVLDWLDVCDEVHTMTSTVGFEALIREKPVVTYGMPFYAAWGLTTDRLDCPRRMRKLSLDELVCGALMKYPRYLNPATGEFTTALKVTRLLTADGPPGDSRALHLKAVSALKKLWVESARKS